MKKFVASAMAAAMAVSLAACGSTSTSTATSTAESKTESTAASSEAAAEETAGNLSGTLEVWSSGEELGRFVEGFNKEYPDVTVNITVVPNADFLTKLTPTLASGQGAPDIFTGESDYVKYLVNSGYWDDLNQEPYNVGQYKDDIWEYVLNVGTDDSGAVRALSWQASPGSILYRRDLAKEVLGTDDPDEVSQQLNSNAAMLDAAAKFSEKGVKMFASWQDIMNMQFSNREQPWVVDDKLIIDDSMLEFMDMAKTISESEKLSVTSTFLRTEEFKHIGFWVTTENHSYMRSCEKSLAFILFILTVPTSGLRRPNIIFNNVDFPLPENPTMAHSSCGRICREISFNTF